MIVRVFIIKYKFIHHCNVSSFRYVKPYRGVIIVPKKLWINIGSIQVFISPTETT